ncbi:MAG: ribonuclease D [Zymomonas mobilis subsp. pomaceae]|uniref:Ribonuclease D n=1 Tax=Zymomonas mobilis subsp. pomaceae (strain ATCC 29192 / DSM 22645 / JCM 10191 / CCUG 17912 / NBRC 13757 / NCIMB 11200 / NRRL B-4491 / Barker I) TaxID=579138 RepID=F8EVU9_ZYMMT|nr:ribonuclease D [Zymomonas mobilis]AEI37426.1 ribonuclease D [Zymomonas mobilis subsp. pomaceae ATCC 29192]MDX5948793.1 ribonuclease D [Zymomonas mobilis subsp. pomaceae]GEB88601.1 ribonuclease D [Zymomonas mobilis subsp. pomaceae]
MQIHPLISDSETLAALCARLSRADFVAIDTEFIRENSYWPELCLIQIADDKEAAAIDPLANGLDMTPLTDLLVNNEQLLKVFHAGGQDLEIVHHHTGKMPFPLFDTQIAAMALGVGEQVGYSNLVEHYLSIKLDKGARFTDWSRRPLDRRQLDYAIGDVTHLATLFPMLLNELREKGRGDWLNQEMERLADPEQYINDPEKSWLRIRIPNRKSDTLGRLKALAAWREYEAQEKNLPRGRIAKDETLADLAAHPPRRQQELIKVRGLSGNWGNNDIGQRLMSALKEATPLKPEEIPNRGDKKGGIGKDGAMIADLLKLLLKVRARDAEVAARLIARSDDIDALIAGQREDMPILTGWRYELFGKDALALIEGKMAFSVQKNKVVMTMIENA